MRQICTKFRYTERYAGEDCYLAEHKDEVMKGRRVSSLCAFYNHN